jgi:hypothetical protein
MKGKEKGRRSSSLIGLPVDASPIAARIFRPLTLVGALSVFTKVSSMNTGAGSILP